MADAHSTGARAKWVQARAGRRPAANRRGQRLAQRARRLERYEAGAGDAAAGEVLTRPRFTRRATEHDDHGALWTIWSVLVETGRLAVAGPGIALSWLIYGVWWRNVKRWGPIRWQWLALAAVAAPVPLIVGWAVGQPEGSAAFWTAYVLAQIVVGVGRSAWLAYAYGWEAVETASTAGSGRITVRLHGPAALPETTPTEPVTTEEATDRTPSPITVRVPRSNSNTSKER